MCVDKIFYGGNIITMDENNKEVEAVAIKDGKIIDLGKVEDIVKLKSEDTNMIDLEGNVLMPGFLEPHTHPELSAILYDWVDVSGFNNNTKEDVFEQIKKACENTPEGEWVPCFGYDSILIRDLEALKKEDLDKISTKHPIMVLIQSMHTAYANSKALEVVGITKDTKDPNGGKYLRDENGEPNGIIVEQNATMPFLMSYLSKLKKSPKELMDAQYKRYKDEGITTVWTAGYTPVFPNFMKFMKEEIDKEECPIRMSYALSFNQIESGLIDVNNLASDSDKYQFTGYKFWYDGSPYTANMFMEENYLESELMQVNLLLPKDNAGERLFAQEQFEKLIESYHTRGKQLSVHTQGDRSTREVLEVFENVLKKHPRDDHRHRLEHCALMKDEEIKKASELGITLSFHSNHILFYGEALRDEIIGKERASKLMPANTALKNGHKISFHTDSPMYPAGPLSLVKTAITRKTQSGSIIGKDEAISVHEALKGITIEAAWQLFKENEIGSIEVGKFADFVVLDKNPYEVDVDDLDKIEILTTYLNGVNTNK